jgi:ABC-type nitrate/sulfonate/bicarbonate transport system ATPase subunit
MADVEIRGLVWSVGNDEQYRLNVDPLRVAAGEIGIIDAAVAAASEFSDVLIGLARPLRGDVRVRGKPVGDLPPGGRGIGLVPSGGGLLPHLTVERNVGLGLGSNVPRARRRAQVGEALEALQLAHLRRLRPHEISPEQRWRVAVARAMCASPETVAVVVEDGVGPATCRAAVMTAAEQDLSVLMITGVPGRALEIPWRVRAACQPVPVCGETC